MEGKGLRVMEGPRMECSLCLSPVIGGEGRGEGPARKGRSFADWPLTLGSVSRIRRDRFSPLDRLPANTVLPAALSAEAAARRYQAGFVRQSLALSPAYRG